ncbi:MAG: hypothetical protein HEQ35_10150 [Gloeotrichia echinulata IR180]|jgi:hypothetical protein|nr:hypothetical protein [Gloeotrichia echinulata DEX184]
MDPITTAIVTAVGTGLVKDVITDSYNALKAALKKKFGDKSDLVDAVEQLEKKPDSEARKATVQEEVETAKANDAPDVVKLAQYLLDKIKEQPGGQEIINQTQTNTASGNTVSGNFNFAPVQEGKKS